MHYSKVRSLVQPYEWQGKQNIQPDIIVARGPDEQVHTSDRADEVTLGLISSVALYFASLH